MKKYNLKDFELSQAYLFFWDKLEKANWFLEQIIDTADQDLDSRLIQELLGAPVNDGGQWDMAANLVTKYGLVCHYLHHHIPASTDLNRFLKSSIPTHTTP